MLQPFTHTHPIVYVITLLCIILLRLPTFSENYISNDEAMFLNIASMLDQEKILYKDIWLTNPPLTTWIYSSFHSIFSGYALWAIRAFSCLYICIITIYIHHIFVNFRFIKENSFSILLSSSLFLCSPWYIQSCSDSILILLPIILSIVLLLNYLVDEVKKWETLFFIGFLIGVSILINYVGLIYFLLILFSYLFTANRPRLKEIFIFFNGLLTVLILFFIILHIQGNLYNFFDLTILTKLDLYRSDFLNIHSNDYVTFFDYIKIWGIIFIFCVLGFFAFRVKFYSTIIRQRKVEIVMTLWLIFGLIQLILNVKDYNHLHINTFLPPILFYSFYYYKNHLHFKFKKLLFSLSFTYPTLLAISFFSMYILNTQEQFNTLASIFFIDQNIYYKSSYTKQETALIKDISNHSIHGGIFIAGYYPKLYHRLNQYCELKYVDFRTALVKMTWLDINHRNSSIISKDESLKEIYHTFELYKPSYIIDPHNFFSEIKNRIPLLLKAYKMKKIGKYKVYYLN